MASTTRPARAKSVAILVIAAAYFAAGALGLTLATTHGSVTLVWPPTGIALAALVLGGVRLWPGVLLGALTVNLAFGAASPAAAVMIAVGNTLEAVVAAAALRRLPRWSSELARPSDLVAFLVVGVIATPAIAAGIGVSSLVLAQDATAASTTPLLLQWWVGDACGALTVAPIILAWAHVRSRPRPASSDIVLSLGLGAVMLTVSFVAWRSGGVLNPEHPMPAMIAFPFVVWFGLRFGQIGAATAAFATVAVAIWGTTTSTPHADLAFRLGELWIFLGVVSVSGMLAGIGAERHRVAAALIDSESRYRTLVESAPNCIEELSLDGEILAMNTTGVEMTGLCRDQLVGTSMLDLVPGPARARLARELERARRGEQTRFEITIPGDDSEAERTFVNILVPLRDRDGAITRIIGHANEVTSTRRAEQAAAALREQLLHTHKLESLGRLASGIAHDFNNLIAVMLGHSELIREDVPGEHPAGGSIEAIEHAAERAAELCAQMLAYAGQARFAPRTLDVADEVRGISELLRITLPKSASLRLDLDRRSITVDADPSQLRQVLLNLIRNAADAVTTVGGAIRVRTGTTRCDASDIARWPLAFQSARPGEFAWFEVEDDGEGMSESTRDHLFDPFFTTKPRGRGLGLATTQGVVRAHGGGIEIESALGAGTRMRVLLPLSEHAVTVAEPRTQICATPRQAAVLVVDDERSVRNLSATILERAGYTVLTARDGRDALAQLGDGLHVDVVLLDVSMPHLDGYATLARLRELRPGLPVILTSGHAEPPTPSVPFLHKPWRRDELLAAIHAAVAPRTSRQPRPALPSTQPGTRRPTTAIC